MMDIDHQGSNGSNSDGVPLTGIIYPPPEIKSNTLNDSTFNLTFDTNFDSSTEMIEKAAANLATKGPELEQKIREKNEDGRFNFLNPGDPYYAFYRFKYEEAKNGTGKYLFVLLIIPLLIGKH